MTTKLKVRTLITNSAILFGIVLLIAVFVYMSLTTNIIATTDRELIANSVLIRGFFSYLDGDRKSSAEEYKSFETRLGQSSLSFCVWDEDLKRQNAPRFPDDAILAGVVRLCFSSDTLESKRYDENGTRFFIHEYIHGSQYYRICTSVSANDSGRLRVVQVIGNMVEKNDITSRLVRTLVLAGVFGMAASFLMGLFITGRAVRPIEENIRRHKEFLADASHELRTPITIVRTNLELAMSSPDDTVRNQARWLTSAYRETERMQRLIEDLLTIARADLSGEVDEFSQTDLIAVLKSAVDRIREVAARKSIIIELETQTGSAWGRADPSRVEQLFVILLDNAAMYSPEGSIVRVGASRRGSTLRVEVADEGIGIDPGEYDKIFERFYRSDKARSRRAGGTGLGLAIAVMIVKSHAGSISVSGVKGKGATFTVELPVNDRTSQ